VRYTNKPALIVAIPCVNRGKKSIFSLLIFYNNVDTIAWIV